MSKCKITGKVLSVQLGRDETQVALIGPGGDVLYQNTLVTPPGAVEDGAIRNQEAIRALLKLELGKEELKNVRQVVFPLCTSQVISQTVTTPDLPAQRLEKLLVANADMYFQVPMKDYRLMWQVIGPKSRDSGLKELLVQLWAVPNAILSRYYLVANACGLSVAAIDYCGHSIANAVGASFARTAKAAKAEKARQKLSLNMEISFKKKPEEAPVPEEPRNTSETQLYITVYKDLAGMTFVQEDQVVYQRFIPCGTDPVDQYGELAMMVEYFRSLDAGRGSHITAYACGSVLEQKRDIRYLGDYLGISVEAFEEEYDTDYTLCVGAAHTTMDFGDPSQNHPAKAVSKVGNQIGQYALVLVGGAALIGVILLTLSSRLIWDSSIKDLESTRLTLTVQVQNTKDYADNFNRYQNKYNSYSADWDKVFGSLHTYNDNLVKMLEELEETLPTNASIANMQIAADGMTVQFACENKEVAAYLIIMLRQLEYADLVSISNLSGGGGGVNYSTDPKPEKPPTEGGLEAQNTPSLMESLLSQYLDEAKMLEVASALTPTEVDQLQSAYGYRPATSYNTMADLKSVMNPTLDQRKAALTEMLTSNPFAMMRFAELVDEDMWGNPPILMGDKVLMDILSDSDLMGAFDFTAGLDANALFPHRHKLVAILTKDEANITATENLLATDPETEKWNVYYLEAKLGMQAERKFPYLDMDQIIMDMLDHGGFNTGNKELDAKLNAMIPQDLLDMLENLRPDPPITGDDPPVTGGDDPPVTGGEVDPNFGKEQLAAFMNQYLETGTTGNLYIDSIIENYLANGTTGNKDADKVINGMINDYMSTGTTDNAELDKKIDAMLQDYLKKGTTGHAHLDKLIADNVKALVLKYMQGGTGVKKFDDMIAEYLNNMGTNPNPPVGPGGNTDVYFTVTLKYKEELMKEELDRKGLDYDDKLKQEVTVK